ncbi:biotin--[acetyl-CoA-carboxylase] ligase [Canicola haemoglobinophilus]|uniref:biotin--[biotin carboxyl-carrier protein] ligase n=1 Tax=Canicola haemoglobinophilus TaxID=733 RepID=A0A1V4AYM6_9PAST|nr:bifunctional biotin--[acetyl-CoA-carboxylase] ligase/biotin operon repressor BirA [Canicola haemoglobinophilus]OOR97129.1 biotin--[acetyl-CoA-carboxylase] ligase [Canicola haemoglobinophilus]STO55657.1 biotin--protein ligase [Canicola haemoglobinophilus]STO58853.1 biotin--protein ligase [Canicola haemoglobinophilus]STO67983.1 biotin--protein ligase [Canicola haemoglobinophilus]
MFKLLSILADCHSHSYKKLTALLDLTEDQIEEQIVQLRQEGIFVITNEQNISLHPQLPLLNPSYLAAKLSPHNIYYQPIINSTNQYLMDNISRLNKGDLCFTEYQFAGRGRRGRQWLSPFAGQLIVSFYWTLSPNISLNGLSSVLGLATAETLNEMGADVKLKWPNDLLLYGRKLAGILVEIVNAKNGLLNFIVGIGINLSLPQKNKIDQPWAELEEVLTDIDRNELAVKLVQKWYQYLNLFEQQGMVAFAQRWIELDHFLGQEVNVISEKEIISGVEQGIDENGYLLLALNNGELRKFNGGEVSLRKKG